MRPPETRAEPDARAFARPRVVLSMCLEIEACRYNGRMIRSGPVRRLQDRVDFVPVCPEVEIGLGTPRDPIRLVRGSDGGSTRLVQPTTGRDLTDAMTDFRERFLDGAGEVDGFILKSRSPSCGIDGVPVHPGPLEDEAVGREPGMFAAAVLERFPGTPVEHEARLADDEAWDAFATRIFAHADLRAARAGMADLVGLQSRHKLALMARSPSGQKELGRIVANAEGRPFDEVYARYASIFREIMAAGPGRGGHQNALQHAFGYVRHALSADEKAGFARHLDAFRAGEEGLGPLLALLRTGVHRSDERWLAEQSYLTPYPRELAEAAQTHDAVEGP